MKKSQVLAAIALAFALGVVAPVAGVYNSASAVTITDGQILSSEADVQATIAAIEGQTEYQQYKKLVDAVALTTGANAVTDNTIEASDIGGLVAKVVALGTGTTPAGVAYDYTNYTAPTTGSNASKLQTVIDDAEAAIANVTGKSYSLWNAIYEAYTTDSKATSDQQKAQALVTAAENLGMTIKDFDPETDDFAAVKAKVDGTSYATYAPTIALIVSGQTKVTDTNNTIGALKAALAPFADARDIAAVVDGATPIAGLLGLAPTTTQRYTDYSTLITAVATQTTKIENGDYDDLETEGAAATSAINALKAAYKTASGSDLNVPTTPENPDEPGTTVSTLTNGNVTVTGAFPEGAQLAVKPHTDKIAAFGTRNYIAYDIEVQDQDGKAIDFEGSAAVAIRVTGAIDGAKSDLYYVNEDGQVTKLDATFADGYMNFTANHFSIYAIVERAADGTSSDNKTDDKVGAELPDGTNTGIMSSSDATAKASVSIMAAIATALTAAGAAIVAFRRNRAAKKN